jgi:hypothetical protein
MELMDIKTAEEAVAHKKAIQLLVKSAYKLAEQITQKRIERSKKSDRELNLKTPEKIYRLGRLANASRLLAEATRVADVMHADAYRKHLGKHRKRK